MGFIPKIGNTMGELNRHDLKHYIDKYTLQVFVETGTGRGVGLNYALQFNFKKLFSIEINEQLYKENRQRINDSRCCLINKNSIDGLREVMTQIDKEGTLFWLDAHFPGADFKYASYDDEHPKEIKYPLESELQLLCSTRSIQNDVFIIDDLQLYEEGNFELKMEQAFVEKHKQNGQFIYDIFSATHEIIKDYRHQGFWILVPKGK